MAGEIRNYFPGGNTCRGFYSFYEYLPQQAELIFVIKGGPGTGKSTFMKEIGDQFLEAEYDVEFHWCSSDANSLDGIVIPKVGVALLDGTAPHLIDPDYPGVVEEIINLGRYWDRSVLKHHQQEIITLTEVIWKLFDRVYAYLEEAKVARDILEKYYIENRNMQKINRKIKELGKEIFTGSDLATNLGDERHLFASALTPQGRIDYYDELIEKFKRCFLIKGPLGTGKSTLLEKVGEKAQKRGLKVNYFHCPFAPDRLEAVTIPKLNVVVINREAFVFKKRGKEEEVIDMGECLDYQTVKEKQEEMDAIGKRFEGILEKALAKLRKEKKLHDELEEIYKKAMNFELVDKRRNQVLEEICEWAEIEL